jgi:pyrroloquinoline-quinone synthase
MAILSVAHVETSLPPDVEDVITRCNLIVQERKYSRHRFVAAVEQTAPGKAALGNWALQKYHQVYLQNAIFSIIHSKTSYEDVRQFMVEQLVAEETGINCGSDTHYNLMRRFAAACGVTDRQFIPATASQAVRNYVDVLLGIMRDEHFVIGLLTIYAIESQSGESVGKLVAALRKTHDFSDAELEWFTVHSGADDDHAEEGVRLVRKYAADVPDFPVRAVAAVEKICDAWLTLHDHYASLLTDDAIQ